jgi:hypothetical protein
MYIGIIYDAYTNDSWHSIEKDIYSLKEALKTIKLPLPVACIFDTLKNDFVELDEAYLRYRTELLEKARRISQLSSVQSKSNHVLRKPIQIFPQVSAQVKQEKST